MTELSYPARTAYQSQEAAETYDQIRFKSLKGRLADKREKEIIGKLLSDLPEGSLVLDLACGTGRITEFLLSEGYRVCGADISQEMLKVAQQRLGSFGELFSLRQTEAENLPFEEKFFDSATCIKLLGHVPPQARVKILQEIRRVTKGPFIVAYYMSGPIANTKRRIRKFLTGNKALWFPISKRELKEEISSANLRILKAKPVGRFVSETWILLVN
jgi:ubiquinone/menaquinone biosynthesis C-methylase UbiE